MNLVILEGALSRPAELRPLPSGSTLVSLEVTIETERGPAESAPVVYFDAPAWVSSLTEVVAHRVVRQTSVTLARRVLREVSATVDDAAQQVGVID